jgi:hypothetical protein
MLYYQRGSATTVCSADDLRAGLFEALDRLGPRKRVIAVPPDFTRFHSQAGQLTVMAHEYYRDALTDVLPAIGTHYPMNAGEMSAMFGGIPHSLFRVHDWRNGHRTLGTVPEDFVTDVSEGRVTYPIPIQVEIGRAHV